MIFYILINPVGNWCDEGHCQLSNISKLQVFNERMTGLLNAGKYLLHSPLVPVNLQSVCLVLARQKAKSMTHIFCP